MISGARTKITSWLRSPKSLGAKVGIGAVTVLAVSVPAVSAMVLTGEPEKPQNSVVSTENQAESADQVENIQEKQEAAQDQPESTSENTQAHQDNQNSNIQPTQPTQSADPETPTAPVYVYADTYPAEWKNQCGQLDTWGLNKCQSTSYAAWKVSESGKNMPKYWGDASAWPAKADAANIPRGTTPKLHSVAVVGNFNAFVEAVDGDTITVSWYNWGNTGQYGVWENIPASKFSTYIYF